ncbi:DUF4190 domain-containing protein [Cellulomonas sp.]|uniref:DUF4190 domain-containing protein n=1 Tax=Cellulomonas sp. TaxID=40001 RepID=UPI001B2B0B75|nr:DUF4190 domain-containing protein [Cellulomonas sp.]MBO9553462.1 DUF4190 domain-containing protein [Cellulomonas sp.]
MSHSPDGANPYAAPDQPSNPGEGVPPAPAPSGYEAVPPASSGYEATPSPYGSAYPTPGYPAASDSRFGSGAGDPFAATPQSAPPPAPYGSPTYGAAPVPPPYGSAPASPYGPAPVPPYGSAPGYGPTNAPGQPSAATYPVPYGTPGSPYGTGAPTYGGVPGYGGAPGYVSGYGTEAPGTDGLAIASLVTSVGGFVILGALPSPVGLGLGIASLRRIRRTGAGGRGLAIAGVVVGGIGTLVLVGAIAVGLLMFTAYQTDPEFRQGFDEGWSEGMSGTGTESSGDAYYELRTDLSVGTCIAAYPTEYDMSDAELVDCTTPHDTEVVGTVQLTAPVTTDPEDTEYAAAVDLCYDQIEAAAPGLLDVDGFADVFTPHPDDFDEPGGDTGWCVFVSDGESLTGSITGGDLDLGDEVTES